MENMNMYAGLLLLVGGLAHAVPQVYEWLKFGGYPWIQLIVGVLSIIFALMLFMKK